MVTEVRDEARPAIVTLHCRGKRRHSETPCNHVLGRLTVEQFVGSLEIKCPKCGTVAEFR